MTREETAAMLIDVMKESIEEHVDWDTITEDSDLLVLGFDSLTVLDFLFYLKEKMGITVDAKELDGVVTFASLITFVEQRIQPA